MDDRCDVLVIGGGMAGLIAGITTAQSDLVVSVIKQGSSATAMSSGAIDFAGYIRGGSTPFIQALEGVEVYSQIYPYHPYTQLCSMDTDDLASTIKKTIEWFSQMLKGTSSEVVGSPDGTITPLTYLGTRKPTCLVQRTMYTEKLHSEDEVLLIVGLKGLPDFSAATAAKALMDSVINSGEGPSKIAHTNLECYPFGKSFNISPIEVARYVETEEGFSQLCDGLKAQVDQLGASMVAVPPVLGLKNPLKIKHDLERETCAEIFELLAFPPSVPGYRLERSLETQLKKSGGRLLKGHRATDYLRESNKISQVTLESPRRKYTIIPKTVILATGKFIGNGLQSDGAGLSESVFGIPVVDGNRQPVTSTKPRNLTEVVSIQSNGHEIFECGIAFDDSYRPLDENGNIFASNLFAAGSILSGYNYPAEKSGLGIAMSTGRVVGKLATNAITEVSK